MTEPSERPDERGAASAAATPRWVKIFAAVAATVLVLFAILALAGRGGEHGPGRHSADVAAVEIS